MRHTSTPWVAIPITHPTEDFCEIMRADAGLCVTECVHKDNAAHIVRCVNNFDALVSALEAIERALMADTRVAINRNAALNVARAALAAAKGEA